MLLTEKSRLIKKVSCTDTELVVRFSGSVELNIQLPQRAGAADHLDRFKHYKTQQAQDTEGCACWDCEGGTDAVPLHPSLAVPK